MSGQELQVSIQKIDGFKALIQKAMPDLIKAVPETAKRYLTPDRMTKIFVSAVVRNPVLLQCTESSLLSSIAESVSLGLEPTGGVMGQAYLVPYRNNKTGKHEAQLIVGYRGLITLARRSDQVSSIDAHVVYARDNFQIEFGMTPILKHSPTFEKERGEIIAAYCIGVMKDGSKQCEFMTREEIESIKARSRARDVGPWKTDFAEMCRKTVVRRSIKYMPMSIELARALDNEDVVENGDEPEYKIYEMEPKQIESQLDRIKNKAKKNNGQSADTKENKENKSEETETTQVIINSLNKAKTVTEVDEIVENVNAMFWNDMAKDGQDLIKDEIKKAYERIGKQ